MFFPGDQLNLSQVEDEGWQKQAHEGAQADTAVVPTSACCPPPASKISLSV